MVANRSSAASFTTEPGWGRRASNRSEVCSAPSASLGMIPRGDVYCSRARADGEVWEVED